MRSINTFPLFLVFILFIIGCEDEGRKQISNDIGPYDYLVGDWIRLNNREGQITYESWTKKGESVLYGIGFTIENSDTVFKETLQLKKMGKEWFYIVSGVNEEATSFLISEQNENSFVCINELNEFPKKIAYSYNNSLLSVTISADSTQILFQFTSQN